MKRNLLNSLKVQITLVYTILSISIVTFLGFILYYSISDIVINDAIARTTVAVDKSGEHLESYIDKINSLTIIISKNPSTLRYLSNGRIEDKRDIENMILNSIEADKYISSIIIVGKTGAIISNEKSLDMIMSDDMMKEKWYVSAIACDGKPSLTSARMQKFNMDKNNWVISLSRDISNSKGENIGVILIDFKYSVIENYLGDLKLGHEGYSYILNTQDEVVYYKDISYFEDKEKQRKLIYMSKTNMGDASNNLLVHNYKVRNTDWILTGVTSLDGLSAIKRQLIETIIFVSILGLIIILISVSYVAKRVSEPIRDLEESIKDIENGFKDIQIDEKSCNEVQNLTNSFNYMINRIKILLNDISKQEKSIRRYELNVLHSQINPHFLYNTLDTIVWMAEFKDVKKVVYLTKTLANFFRLSLNGGNEHTTIENEVEHVKHYLMIQKERYCEKLNYSIEMSQDIKNIKVPKIILQPIVENAIYHGIRELDGEGHITIRINRIGEDIIFSIKDNGNGFSEDKLKLEESEKQAKLGGVGIKNVAQRIKLIYGEKYGLNILTKEGEGTEVIITINSKYII